MQGVIICLLYLDVVIYIYFTIVQFPYSEVNFHNSVNETPHHLRFTGNPTHHCDPSKVMV